jgi:hypothetical protein
MGGGVGSLSLQIPLEYASSSCLPFRSCFPSNSIVRQRNVIICNCFWRCGGIFLPSGARVEGSATKVAQTGHLPDKIQS